MAKINKYWGLVAVGALTAAAAGAMAAVLMKNKAVPEFEDDFDEDFDNLDDTTEPEKEAGEAFVSWEEAPVTEDAEEVPAEEELSETEETFEAEDVSEEEVPAAEEAAEEVPATEDASEEETPAE